MRRWIAENDFDVLHIHEPNAPSLSMLALKIAEGPIVATFHTSTTKSLVLSTFQGVLRPYLEKITGRIAVSELARRWQVESLGPTRSRSPTASTCRVLRRRAARGYPRAGDTVLFLGRYDEPRKGMDVLLGALPALVARYPDVEVLVVGRGDEDKLPQGCGTVRRRTCDCSGRSTTTRRPPRCERRTCTARRTSGGESFGIVLVEAMAAGTAVVASELDAFRRVLRDGRAGVLVPIGDSRRTRRRRSTRVLGDDDAPSMRWSDARHARSSRNTTGRWSPNRSCGCTRRSPSAPARSRGALDDTSRD